MELSVQTNLTFSNNPHFNALLLASRERPLDQGRKIAAQSWLRQGHPLGEPENCSFKQLCLMAGDGFIKNSSFEGAPAYQAISWFVDFFKAVGTDPEVTHLLENAQAIAPLLAGDPKTYSKNIMAKTEGDVVWFPCAWQNADGIPHAILVEINRKEQSLTLFNTGQGMDQHACTTVLGTDPLFGKSQSSRDLTFYKLVDCHPQKLNSPLLYQFFYEMKYLKVTDLSDTEKSRQFYEGLKEFIQGTPEKAQDFEKFPLLYRKPQRAGTCSVKSIIAAIYHRYYMSNGEAGVAAFKKQKFLWQTRVLVAVAKQGIAPGEKYLFENIVKNIARSTQKEPLHSQLTAQELGEWEATLLDIENWLADIAAPEKQPQDKKALLLSAKSLSFKPVKILFGNCTHSLSPNSKESALAELQKFELQPVQIPDYEMWSLNELFVEIRWLAVEQKQDEESSARVFACYAAIVKKAVEDPEAKLAGFCLALAPLEEYLAQPYAVCTHPDTHRQMQRALNYLQSLPKGKPLFQLNEGKLLISVDTMQTDPTLLYFSQFIDNKQDSAPLDALVQTIQSNRLPLSAQILYLGTFYFHRFFRQAAYSIHNNQPMLTMIQTNPRVYALDFELQNQNRPLDPPTKYFYKNYALKTHFLEAKRTQNEIASGGKLDQYLGLDEMQTRTMKMLALDRFDLPNRLVAFFSKHVTLFAQEDMCAYFLNQLFRPLALIEQIDTEPLFLEKLTLFCHDTIEHFIQTAEYDQAMNCLAMTRVIEHFLKEAGYETNFNDPRKTLLERLLPLSFDKRSPKNRAKWLKVLLEWDPKNLENLAAYVFSAASASCPIEPKWMNMYRSAVKQLENSPAVKDILLKCLGLQGKDYVVDFAEIAVYASDRSLLATLPIAIKSHPYFCAYFKNCAFSWKQLGHVFYFSADEGKKELRIELQDTEIKLFRTMHGKECVYAGSGIAEEALLGLSGTLWYSQRDRLHAYFVAKNSDQPCMEFIYRPEYGYGNRQISKVTRLADGAKLLPEATFEIGRNSLTFADVWVDLWVDSSQEAHAVLSCKYDDLRFDLKQGALYCEQYPGYFIVDNDQDSFLKNALVLQNETGQKKYFLQNTLVTKKRVLAQINLTESGLKGAALSDTLFLIQLHLEQHNYESAFSLFKELHCLERIKNDEQATLHQLLLFLEHKGHPDAQAFYLQLLKFALENNLKFPAQIGQQVEKLPLKEPVIKKILTSYLSNETNSDICRLSAQQKESLLHILKDLFPKTAWFTFLCSDWCGRVVIVEKSPVEAENIAGSHISNPNFKPKGVAFSKDYFKENFNNLQEIAKGGSKEEKQWLKQVLDFNIAFNNNSFAYTIIRKNYYNPYFYSKIFREISTYVSIGLAPQIQKLKNFCFKNQLVPQEKLATPMPLPSPITVDHDTLQAADTLFDDYLKNLREAHFNCSAMVSKESSELIPLDHPSPLVKAKIEKENEELVYFRTHLLKAREEIVIQNADGLLHSLKEAAGALSARLKTLKIALLWQLNQGETFTKIGSRRKLAWADLQRLSISGDFEAFRQKTALDPASAEQVLNTVGYYLLLESRRLQLTQAANSLGKWQSENPTPQKGQLLLQQVHETLSIFTSEVRNYAQIERLWFECANRYLYRKNQIEKLEEIIAAKAGELQAEMPTGWGKTKTGIPTLNEYYSKHYAVFNCWPATLEMTNTLDMNAQMQKSFGRTVDRLTFDRSSNFTAEGLAAIYRSLVDNKTNKRPVNCSPEAIRALELHFILTLEEGAEDDKKLEWFRKILRFLRTKGWATIDEEHLLLNPLDRLIYTMGTPLNLEKRDVEVIQKLFSLLLDKRFDKYVDLSRSKNSLDVEAYQEVANALAASFYDHFACKENRQEFIDFVLGSDPPEPTWLKDHPQREAISLVRGILTFILKDALNGSVDETFGLSHEHIAKAEFAISYLSADTPKETKSAPSQYRNPHETLVKTFITYLFKGLKKEQVKRLLEDLKEQAEIEALQGISLASTAASKTFDSLKAGCNKPLMQLDTQDIALLSEQLRRNPSVIFHYIATRIVPQIKIYPKSIESTAQNFRSQFCSSLSLSATPQEAAAHGPKTKFLPMRGTSGQVSHLLLTQCKDENTIHRSQETTSAGTLKQIVLTKLQEKSSRNVILDIGAQCKGLSNLDIATQIVEELQADEAIKGVLFFDETEGVFKILEKGSKRMLDLSTQTTIAPEERVSFYDQSRCLGSDILQACDAAALLLTSSANTKAEIGQGIGRMRQLAKGQKVEPVIPNDMAAERDIKQLLVYWIANQVEKEAKLNYYALDQQYDNVLRRGLLDEMIDPKRSDSQVKRIYNNSRDIFVSKESFSPYAQYAHTPKSINTLKALEAKRTAVASSIQKTYGLSQNARATLLEELTDPQAIKIALPETVTAASSLGMQTEVLQEVEVNVELEVENQAVSQSKVILRTPMQWNDKLHLFKAGWEGAGSLFPLFKRTLHKFFGRFPGTLIDETIIWAKKFQELGKNMAMGGAVGFVVSPIAVPLLATAEIVMVVAIVSLVTLSIPFITINLVLEFLACIAVMTAAALTFSAAVALCGAFIFTLSLAVEKIAVAIAKRYHTDNLMFRVDELMRAHLDSNISACHALFAPEFYATNNFYRQNSYDLQDQTILAVQTPFDVDQKPLFQVLVIEDAATWWRKKRLRMIAIDANDSQFFREKLRQDANTTAEMAAERTRKVGIYDLSQIYDPSQFNDPSHEMFVAQGKNRFSLEELQAEPEFHHLLASAKFLNGEINYTDKELGYLQAKFEEIGKKAVKELFLNKILPFQPKNKRCLGHSKIGRLLT